MRWEVAAAYAMGIGLPVLETCRRGGEIGRVVNYVDDFLAGGLLLCAAIACSRRLRAGPVLLVVAWAVVCGGFYYSLFGQLASTSARDVSGLSHASVIAIKAVLYLTAIAALVASSREVIRRTDSG